MKNPGILISCLFLFSFTGDKKIKNAPEEYNLSGKVKTYITCSYEAYDSLGVIVKKSITLKSTVMLDEAGYVTDERVNDSLYTPCVHSVYKRDKCHYITNEDKLEHVHFLEKGDSLAWNHYTHTYKYDSAGNAIEEKINKNGQPWKKIEKEYNSAGNLVKEITYRPVDSLNEAFTYTHNSKGTATGTKWYNAKNELMYKTTFGFDSISKQVNSYFYEGNDTAWEKFTTGKYYNYDKEGNALKAEFEETSKAMPVTGKRYTVIEYVYEYYK